MIYLDNNATTALDGRVREAMLPYLDGLYGNPSSVHRFGRLARSAIDQAREQVAALVGAHPSQVIFTSGGTEANNLALQGYCGARSPGRQLLLHSAVEHPSVVAPLKALQRAGWEVVAIAVDEDGVVTEASMRQALQRSTALVSVMLANNETGTIQDIGGLSELVRGAGAVLHTDAVQAAGKTAIDFRACGAQLMTLSAHKIHGPQGVGALIVDKALELTPLVHGGGHEKGLRAGTENVAGIVGFGAAAELADQELEARRAHMRALREYLEERLSRMPGVVVFGRRGARLPNTVQIGLQGIDGETLLMNLDRVGIAVSSGAACSSGSTEPSRVLTAMGIEAGLARSAIRISLGKDNSSRDIDVLCDELAKQAQALAARSAAFAG